MEMLSLKPDPASARGNDHGFIRTLQNPFIIFYKRFFLSCDADKCLSLCQILWQAQRIGNLIFCLLE